MDSDEDFVAALGKYLEEKLCVPVIGEIADSLMSEYYFYNTDNHLSDDGVQIYTKRVINNIKNYLQSGTNGRYKSFI